MAYQIKINNVDKTSSILYDTFRISDYINQQVNQCAFSCKSFKPSLNDDIMVYEDTDKIFGGVIVKIETERVGTEVIYMVTAKDYSQYLNRRLVSERYINKTVGEIIHDLLGEYATDFTVDSAGLDDITHRYKLIQDSTDSIGSTDGVDTDMTYNNEGIFNGTTSQSVCNIPLPSANWSVSVKFKMSSNASIRGLLDFSNATHHLRFFKNGSGSSIEIDQVGGEIGNVVTAFGFAEWFTLTATYDGTNLRIYKNGVLSSTTAVAFTFAPMTTLIIGGEVGARFLGSIKDVRIYDRVITGDEALLIHDGSLDNSITQITFNRINLSQCIQSLAELLNYSWYVDSDKDIHFFPENDEVAPFNLSETAGNHIWNSLKIIEDFSQIRNQVYIIGGEYEAEERSESYVADGEQKQFNLAYKYNTLTRVRIVGDPDLTVGIDGEDEEADFDVFWNPKQKYIRFKDSNYPDASDVLEVSGKPLFQVFVKVPDINSIAEHGLYEFKIKDSSITSRTDAVNRGIVELEAYANSIEEGSFTTTEYGLKSGQTININIGDTNEDFIIQSVSMNMDTPFEAKWNVKVATVRTLGIIRFLQKYLKTDDEITEGEVLLELQQFTDGSLSSDSVDSLTTHASQDYYWGDDTAQSYDSYWDFSTWD